MKKESKKVLDYLNNVFNDYEKTENKLNALNQHLSVSNQQLLATEQQLRAANQQLTASELQLKAANQQLKANNQQLLATEQQLRASNQQLTATEQQLRAANQQLEASNVEIRQKEKEAVAAKEFAENIISTLREPLLVLDADLKIITANESFYKTFRVSEKDTLGRFVYELGNHQWDIPALRKLLLKILPDKSEIVDFEVEHLFENIGQRTMLLNAKELKQEDEKNKMILLAIEDITERKQAEAELTRLNTAIEQSAEAIVITDIDGNIQYVNPAFEQITGYPRNEVIGQNPRILKSGKHEEPFYKDLWDTITSGSVWRGRIINRRKDGSLYTEEDTISPVIDKEGKITNFVAVKRDISKEQMLEEQLLQSQKMEAVGTLAGGVAHDFNNLLTIIQGHAELMMLEISESDPNYRELRQIVNATTRAASLTRQLLLFSRKEMMEFKPINLNETIGNLLKMLKRLIGEDIRIVTSFDDDLWQVNADESNLEQVIMNIAVNARDAMPEGGTLNIKTENLSLSDEECRVIPGSYSGKFVRLTIEDTGTGIPKEIMDKIFEPFFSTKEVGKGTGLGLSVVFGIVKKHNGWINVYSEPGQGAVFRIYLPAVSQAVEKTEENKNKSFQDLRGHGERILIIEDNRDVRDFASAALRQNGYVTYEAENAAAAVDVFRTEKGLFDLILSDVVLPDKNGFQLVKELLEIKADIPVIMCSGYTEERARHSIVHEEGFQFLQKPYSLNKLLEIVKETLR